MLKNPDMASHKEIWHYIAAGSRKFEKVEKHARRFDQRYNTRIEHNRTLKETIVINIVNLMDLQ